MGTIDWPGFLMAALVVSAVPGANQLLSLRNAVRQGAADATVALAGRFSAFVVLVALAAGGLGAVLVTSATAFALLKWAGVAYLAWLGLALLWASRRSRASESAASTEPIRGRWALVRQEFTVAITNPKALLLFASFIPQFAPPTGATPQALAVLGLAYIGVEAVSAVAYTLVGGRLNGIGLTGRVRRRLDQVSGVAFLGLAGLLAAERRA